MKNDLIEFVVCNAPLSFFTQVIEKIEEAYFMAYRYSLDYAEPEQKRILPQMRHYLQNGAFRDAASVAGLVSCAPNTKPKGERYSVAYANNITFSRTAVRFNNRIPRPALHRAAIAALNARFEPVNFDLFESITPPIIGDALGCLIVTVDPPYFEGQSVPRDIYLGVPYTNLKDWHLFVPLTEVIAAYRPAQELQVPDLAIVTLKKKLRDAEG